MADSWDLLHETMMKVNNVLGDYWMGDIEGNSVHETNEFISDFGHSLSEANSSVAGDFSDFGDHSDSLQLPDPVLSDQSNALSELMSDCQSLEDTGMSGCQGQEDAEADMEPWPPQPRARSNTWPRRQFGQMSQVIVTRDTGQASLAQPLPLLSVSEEGGHEVIGQHVTVSPPPVTQIRGPSLCPPVSPRPRPRHSGEVTPAGGPRKNSRRNPWGNCSYSDLIEQAILSSPEKRLTLNQIYDWLISSVMYFSERQDNLASSGWKNSIRHNLSLHQRFVKVPNEDAGKSSWWTVSPDQAKPAVTKARRRATYGESRERMKKRAEAARARGRLLKSSSPSLNPLTSYQDSVTPSVITSPFRHRSNSNASSCDDNACSLSLFPGPEDNFRSRSFSNASSASQSSIAQLSELTSGIGQCFQNLNDDISTDLEGIRIEDLSLGCDFMREYLSPPRLQPHSPDIPEDDHDDDDTGEPGDDTQHAPSLSQQSVTILEPRADEMVCNSVMSNMYGNLNTKMMKHLDMKRRDMIKRELSQLIRERVELGSGVDKLLDNKRQSSDLKIKLLQSELDKYQTQEWAESGLNKSLAFSSQIISSQFAI